MVLADVLVTMRLVAIMISIADGIQTLPMELFVHRASVAMALGVSLREQGNAYTTARWERRAAMDNNTSAVGFEEIVLYH